MAHSKAILTNTLYSFLYNISIFFDELHQNVIIPAKTNSIAFLWTFYLICGIVSC